MGIFKTFEGFNENFDLRNKLINILEQYLVYEIDRDYDGCIASVDYEKWDVLMNKIHKLLSFNIPVDDLNKILLRIIPTGFGIGYQDKNLIETIHDGEYDWKLKDEDDRSQLNIKVKYDAIADVILDYYKINPLYY